MQGQIYHKAEEAKCLVSSVYEEKRGQKWVKCDLQRSKWRQYTGIFCSANTEKGLGPTRALIRICLDVLINALFWLYFKIQKKYVTLLGGGGQCHKISQGVGRESAKKWHDIFSKNGFILILLTVLKQSFLNSLNVTSQNGGGGGKEQCRKMT